MNLSGVEPVGSDPVGQGYSGCSSRDKSFADRLHASGVEIEDVIDDVEVMDPALFGRLVDQPQGVLRACARTLCRASGGNRCSGKGSRGSGRWEGSVGRADKSHAPAASEGVDVGQVPGRQRQFVQVSM